MSENLELDQAQQAAAQANAAEDPLEARKRMIFEAKARQDAEATRVAEEESPSVQDSEAMTTKADTEAALDAREKAILEAKEKSTEVTETKSQAEILKQQAIEAAKKVEQQKAKVQRKTAELEEYNSTLEDARALGIPDDQVFLQRKTEAETDLTSYQTELNQAEQQKQEVEQRLAQAEQGFAEAEATIERIVPSKMAETNTSEQITTRAALEEQAYSMASAEGLKINRDEKEIETITEPQVESKVDTAEHTEAVIEDQHRTIIKEAEQQYLEETKHIKETEGKVDLPEVGLVSIEDLDKPENSALRDKVKTLNFAKSKSARRAMPALLKKGLISSEEVQKAFSDLQPETLADGIADLPNETQTVLAQNPNLARNFEDATKKLNEQAEQSGVIEERFVSYVKLMKIPVAFDKKQALGLRLESLVQARDGMAKTLNDEKGYPGHLMSLVDNNSNDLETMINRGMFSKEQVVGWMGKALKETRRIGRVDGEQRIMRKCMQLRDEGLLTPEETKNVLNSALEK
ncbi:MAG: hypothetical protein AAB351_01675 [Patescibacteria group bacterium]